MWTSSLETLSTQQKTLVHIVSILNVTGYAAQVKRLSINILMDKMDETSHDVNTYTTWLLHWLPISAISNLYYTSGQFKQTFDTHYPTLEQFLHILWITLMQLQLEHSLHTFYQ